uniref:Uncharacterized protein n=1 Tax=Glossina brevipalpis TaxID=37001 RepID=A0A1A9WBE0_9MUSC
MEFVKVVPKIHQRLPDEFAKAFIKGLHKVYKELTTALETSLSDHTAQVINCRPIILAVVGVVVIAVL